MVQSGGLDATLGPAAGAGEGAGCTGPRAALLTHAADNHPHIRAGAWRAAHQPQGAGNPQLFS